MNEVVTQNSTKGLTNEDKSDLALQRAELVVEHLFYDEEIQQLAPYMRFRAAMRKVGYPDSTTVSRVMRLLRPHLDKIIENLLKDQSLDAVIKISQVMHNADEMKNARETLNAAKEILDRAGYQKPEQAKVNITNNIVLLPDKKVEPMKVIDVNVEEST